MVFGLTARAQTVFGLKAGDAAPDFEVKNYLGQRVVLSDVLKQGPVVLIFYRGGWCKYCNIQLKAYQDKLDAFQALGVTILALSVDTVESSAESVRDKALGFEVLSNPDAAILDLYHVRYQVPEELAKLYKEKYGIDLEKASGRTDRVIAVPGTFVIDQQGTIRYAYANEDYRARPAPEEILDVIRSMFR